MPDETPEEPKKLTQISIPYNPERLKLYNAVQSLHGRARRVDGVDDCCRIFVELHKRRVTLIDRLSREDGHAIFGPELWNRWLIEGMH